MTISGSVDEPTRPRVLPVSNSTGMNFVFALAVSDKEPVKSNPLTQRFEPRAEWREVKVCLGCFIALADRRSTPGFWMC